MEGIAVILGLLVILWIRAGRMKAQDDILSDPRASPEAKRAVMAERRHRETINTFGCIFFVIVCILWLLLAVLSRMNF